MERAEVLQLIEQAKAENWTVLNLRGKELTEIPLEIFQLSQLTKLDLSFNQITEIPDEITALSNLQELYLLRNQITEIPDVIATLSNLQQLNLWNNKITKVPDVIAALSNLQKLDLVSNQITEIPDVIIRLIYLKIIDIKNNPIDFMIKVLLLIEDVKTRKSTELYLNDQGLTGIPPEIFQLSNLQGIVLGYNKITEIPDAISTLSNLKFLSLVGNQITKIPDAIAALSNLQTLDLSNNQITEIPDALLSHSRSETAALSNLQYLNLDRNQITEIPDAIFALSNLQKLDLSNNQITGIPDALLSHSRSETAALSSLRSLNLDNNQITEIPDAISALSNLQYLNLENNQIIEIPNSITQLVNLKQLILKNNPITNVPPEIIRKGWGKAIWDDGDLHAIFSYLKAHNKRPLNEIKILLVGEGDVGKTSLLNRLLHNTFNPEECKTPGINIKQWNLPEKPDIRLNLWDFGGQKVMHATHQFFLTKRSLYLLVIDNRKNEQQNRVEYWLKLIQTYGGDSPVIIVGNCADEDFPHVKIRTLKKKYPQIILPEKDNPLAQDLAISTSCKTGEGIETLRREIARQIDTVPHIKDLLPVSWFEIKTKLEEMQKDYDFISYEKYQEYCHNTDITSSQDQKVLVEFLHDLGIVLNYQDDPRLKETNVLNPEWVTSGVYDILNNNEVFKKKGLLELTDLNRVLKQPDRYPDNKRPFLMGLMEKFELCFPLDNTNINSYLITDLLPIDEPDVDAYENAPLHFQYRYDILPSSIISRFIVRNHEMIYKTMRWRSGVVLAEGSSKALVRSDEEDNFISIKVQGSRASNLLAIIRSDFTKIHNTIPNLAVKEFLVVQEYDNEQPTNRQVPVDYLHLCNLDRQNITDAILPGLQGNYNIRDLLEGVESRQQREQELEDRREKSNKSRDSQPLKPLPKTTPNLFKPSLALLFLLAGVTTIFAVLAHSVPVLQFTITVIASCLIFAVTAIFVLRITGIIDETAFNQALTGFWNALLILKGQDASKDNASKELPETDKKE
jgi:internalin A